MTIREREGAGEGIRGRRLRVAVACGGTGGHIFPGLATAQALEHRGHEVVLWLAGREGESDSVGGWDADVVRLRSAGFSGGGLRRAASVLGWLRAVLAAVGQMRRERPDVVLAMGSYASVGPGLAAWCLRIPLVLHEGNAVPGRAIRFLAPFATRLGTAFPEVTPLFRPGKAVCCGFPLRSAFDGATVVASTGRTSKSILVMGGSQGAAYLNETAPAALQAYHARGGAALDITHIAGNRGQAAVAARYRSLGLDARVLGFCDDMVRLYGQADFAITRAGAATCTELAMMRLPALLVPLPHAPGNHQWKNAQSMARGGGFLVMAQSTGTVERLADALCEILDRPGRLETMRAALPGDTVCDGAGRLADLVELAAHGNP